MNEIPTEAYPLHWPVGRPRKNYPERARFRTAFGKARNDTIKEIRLLGGTGMIISTNLPLRQDGIPYANQAQPSDPGVAVYFKYKGDNVCFACDRWSKVESNMAAIAHTIGALRGVARWGTGDMLKAAFRGFAALPSPEQKKDWRAILGVPERATMDDVKKAFRTLASVNHSDRGGDDSRMAEINGAYAQAKIEIGS